MIVTAVLPGDLVICKLTWVFDRPTAPQPSGTFEPGQLGIALAQAQVAGYSWMLVYTANTFGWAPANRLDGFRVD